MTIITNDTQTGLAKPRSSLLTRMPKRKFMWTYIICWTDLRKASSLQPENHFDVFWTWPRNLPGTSLQPLHNTLLQHFSRYNTPLHFCVALVCNTSLYSRTTQHYFPILLYSTLLQHLSQHSFLALVNNTSPQTLFSNTSLQSPSTVPSHKTTSLCSNTSLRQPFQHSFSNTCLQNFYTTTVLYNAPLQDWSMTLFSSTCLQHVSTNTLLQHFFSNTSFKHFITKNLGKNGGLRGPKWIFQWQHLDEAEGLMFFQVPPLGPKKKQEETSMSL